MLDIWKIVKYYLNEGNVTREYIVIRYANDYIYIYMTEFSYKTNSFIVNICQTLSECANFPIYSLHAIGAEMRLLLICEDNSPMLNPPRAEYGKVSAT